ncbi:hypothetical protein K1719_021053 [Acacia pycnantha]|nr:hypothetical protein K1719_021053 [Acacia pycnantha]
MRSMSCDLTTTATTRRWKVGGSEAMSLTSGLWTWKPLDLDGGRKMARCTELLCRGSSTSTKRMEEESKTDKVLRNERELEKLETQRFAMFKMDPG